MKTQHSKDWEAQTHVLLCEGQLPAQALPQAWGISCAGLWGGSGRDPSHSLLSPRRTRPAWTSLRRLGSRLPVHSLWGIQN